VLLDIPTEYIKYILMLVPIFQLQEFSLHLLGQVDIALLGQEDTFFMELVRSIVTLKYASITTRPSDFDQPVHRHSQVDSTLANQNMLSFL
jgi:hypothetical protein